MKATAIFKAALACSLALLAACEGQQTEQPQLIIDLNRTTDKDARLTSVISDSLVDIPLSPNAQGTYVLPANSLQAGIYVAMWDSAHSLPLVVADGGQIKVCGSFALWDELTTSSEQTRLAWQADRLRQQMESERDAMVARNNILDPKVRAAVSDSILVSRAKFRRQADGLLRQADKSLAALAVVGIRQLYDPVADYDLFRQTIDNLAPAYADLSSLSALSANLKVARDLSNVRADYARNADKPKFSFVRQNGDSISDVSYLFYKKPFVLALLTDSASTSRKMTAIFNSVLDAGGRLVVQTDDDNVPLPEKPFVIRGHFANLNRFNELRQFAPAILTIGADGLVDNLYLGPNAKQQ